MVLERSLSGLIFLGSMMLVGCASAEAVPEPTPQMRGTTVEPREETAEEEQAARSVSARRRTSQETRCDDGSQPTVEILEKTKVVLRCKDKVKLRVDCGGPPTVTKRRSDGGLSISCT